MNDAEILEAIKLWREDTNQGYNKLIDLIVTIEQGIESRCAECGFFKKDHRPGHWCKKFKELGK